MPGMQVDKENRSSNQPAAYQSQAGAASKDSPLAIKGGTHKDLADLFHMEHQLVSAMLAAAETAQASTLQLCMKGCQYLKAGCS